MMRITDGPWEIERVPIESRGGSNTCWKIGPLGICIYDDWRAREAGISEEENRANAYAIYALPEILKSLQDLMAVMGTIVVAKYKAKDAGGITLVEAQELAAEALARAGLEL